MLGLFSLGLCLCVGMEISVCTDSMSTLGANKSRLVFLKLPSDSRDILPLDVFDKLNKAQDDN